MADHDLEAVDPEVRALVEQAGAASEPLPVAVRARLARRLDLSVALAVSGDPPEPGSATSGAELAKGAASGALAKKAWLLAAGAFVLGTGAGAGLTASMTQPESRAAERRLETAAATLPPSQSLQPVDPPHAQEVAAPAEPAPEARARRRTAAELSPAARDTLLSEERSLVEMARSSLVRGDAAAALQAVQQHARRFPEGRLREERDSLWIQAQLRAGQAVEARDRARKFRTRYPSSLLLPLVESALSSVPVTEAPRVPQSQATPLPKDVHDDEARDSAPKP